MALPELSLSPLPLHSPDAQRDADALVLALPPLPEAADLLADWPGLADTLTAVGFTGNPGPAMRVAAGDVSSLPLFVVGTGAEPSAANVRDLIGATVRTTGGFARLAVAAPGLPAELIVAALEGAIIGGYRFDDYKTSSSPARATHVTVHTDGASESDLHRVRVVGEATALVKDLVNTPAQWLSPSDFASTAEEQVRELPIEITVLDEHELEHEGYGGILGVGQGSARPPRLVRLDYSPSTAERHIALVGKGITFDTGGLSLKPPASMVGMKVDMAGAATALAVVRAAAQLALPVRVSAWLCLTDNMPSGSALRPGDVIRILDGTSVEVLNTDAEGRLVLADGLVAASRTSPDVIVDVATLTGAIIVALGHRHTGVMGEDAAVSAYLAAAERSDELAWRMPLPVHMEDELDSPIADLQNAKIGDPAGGSLFAGLFLQRFVGRCGEEEDAPRIPWVHLDIAGSATTKSAYGANDKGATAATVRSLVSFVEAGGK